MSAWSGSGPATALREALESVLACPACEGALSVRGAGDAVRCGSCAAAYPVRDGIPVLLRDEPSEQEGERRFRDRLAGELDAGDGPALREVVARHHSVRLMRERALRFAARFGAEDWVLDVGVGWAWHWEGHAGPPRVLGIDMSPGNLRLARRLLGDGARRVALVCADAAALPVRAGSIAGLWSVQVFQHMPDNVLKRAKAELDRAMRDDGRIEMSNLNPAPLHRLLYRLAGRRLHRQGRVGEMELIRRSAREWAEVWSDFRRGRARIETGFSELFFHPDFHLRPRRYPLRLEGILAGRAPALAGLIARQVDLRIASRAGG